MTIGPSVVYILHTQMHVCMQTQFIQIDMHAVFVIIILVGSILSIKCGHCLLIDPNLM